LRGTGFGLVPRNVSLMEGKQFPNGCNALKNKNNTAPLLQFCQVYGKIIPVLKALISGGR
jgi:hypothetical protein